MVGGFGKVAEEDLGKLQRRIWESGKEVLGRLQRRIWEAADEDLRKVAEEDVGRLQMRIWEGGRGGCGKVALACLLLAVDCGYILVSRHL